MGSASFYQRYCNYVMNTIICFTHYIIYEYNYIILFSTNNNCSRRHTLKKICNHNGITHIYVCGIKFSLHVLGVTSLF